MNLCWIDWSIIIFVIGGMIASAWYTRRFVRSTADFLVANRVAGKYLLSVSDGSTGAVGTIATWQMIHNAGLSTQWWGMMSMPIGLFIALTGFVTYRLRETRAMTLAQFFEMRYSRRFRLFSGFLCWLSGLLNYGAFPAVAGQLFVTLFGLPEYTNIFGMTIPTTAIVMAIYLVIAVYIACVGGQISLIVSDFLQESFCKIVLISLIIFLLWNYSWSDIVSGLMNAPQGKSMLNPFDATQIKGFNIWYFLIGLYGSIYNVRAWQGNSGYNASACTPHDAQMANIFSRWRDLLKTICVILPPIVAYIVLTQPQHFTEGTAVLERLNQMADPQVRDQMRTPMFMTCILPVGMLGMFVAMFLSGVISVDDTYTHAWGTIFIQDVVMPWRKKPFSAKTHLLLLRLSIIGVAIFGFVFGLLFPFKDAILMFFALTGAIYLGGAGATIIGGLYWRRGTTQGAFAAMIIGTSLAFGGILVEQSWTGFLCPMLLRHFPHNAMLLAHKDAFFLNGQLIYFIAMLASTLSYIIVSLLTGKKHKCDLDKLLHRGKYADSSTATRAASAFTGWRRIMEKLGMSAAFSKADKILFYSTFIWTIGWWLVFVVVTLWNCFCKIPVTFWSGYWHFYIWLSILLGITVTIWMVAGGFRDLRQMLRALKNNAGDASDDGFIR